MYIFNNDMTILTTIFNEDMTKWMATDGQCKIIG